MKTREIFTLLKLKKNSLPVLNGGIQYSNSQMMLSNMETYINMQHDGEVNTQYLYDGELYAGINIEDQYNGIQEEIERRKNFDEIISLNFTDDDKENIKHLLTSVGDDDLRPVMSGIGVDEEYMYGTDAHKLLRYKHKLNLPTGCKFIIPKDAAKIIADASSTNIVLEKDNVYPDQEHISGEFTIDDRHAEFYCQLIDGIYPNVNAVIPETTGYKRKITIDSKDVTGLAKYAKRNNSTTHQAKVLNGQVIVPVNIDLEHKQINTGINAYDSDEPTEFDGLLMPVMIDDDVGGEIGFNAKFIKEMMVGMSSVDIYYNQPNRAMLLKFTPIKQRKISQTKKVSKPKSKDIDVKFIDDKHDNWYKTKKPLIYVQKHYNSHSNKIEWSVTYCGHNEGSGGNEPTEELAFAKAHKLCVKHNADVVYQLKEDLSEQPKEEETTNPVADFIKERIIVTSIAKQEETNNNNNTNTTDMKTLSTLQQENTELRDTITDQITLIEELDHAIDDRDEVVKTLNSEIENLQAGLILKDKSIADLQSLTPPNQVDIEDMIEEVEEEKEVEEVKEDKVKIMKYSDKSFAIYGDTKEFKDIIKKELRARFNRWLKDSDNNDFAGWVFSNKHIDKANELLETFNA